ncbi:class I SAM-dependent DNA methyltransferase [Patescibacteria group bacterium]
MFNFDETRKQYNEFSDYEKWVKEGGYLCPSALVKAIVPYLKGGERILDVACGTGLVGEELEKIGWQGKLIGVDIAEKRLKEAATKKIYSACLLMDARNLNFQKKCFDVVLSCAFIGLVGPGPVRSMHYLVKPNGFLGCVAGACKCKKWSQANLKQAEKCLKSLYKTKVLLRQDLGSGYTSDLNHEYYVLYLLKCL